MVDDHILILEPYFTEKRNNLIPPNDPTHKCHTFQNVILLPCTFKSARIGYG